MSVKPLSPDEVVGAPPEFVVDAVNKLLQQNYDGVSATIELGEISEAVGKDQRFRDLSIPFNNKWLNIETLYRSAGWNVKFDKPGYNESYRAFFVFRKA